MTGRWARVADEAGTVCGPELSAGEIQATAEERPFEVEQFNGLLELARAATTELFALQRAALGID